MSGRDNIKDLESFLQPDDAGDTRLPDNLDDLVSSDSDNGSDNEEPQPPEMVSDGRRMRMVWQPGDGNGDSTPHLIERSMTLVRGHPTWKIFISEIELPIVRGSNNEPPRYVYLDDRACYAIYSSQAYTREEMREFWPLDFNHQGHIKQGRLNRGHPAYLDDSNTEYALGKLRAKGQWYTFSGAPQVTEYKPLRPKKPSKIEEQVAREFKDGVKQVQSPKTVSKDWPAKQNTVPSARTSTKEPPSARSPDLGPSHETATVSIGLQPRRLPPRPLPPNARDSPPFLTSRSTTRPGNLAHLNPKPMTAGRVRNNKTPADHTSSLSCTSVTSSPNARSTSGIPSKRPHMHSLDEGFDDGSDIGPLPRKRGRGSMGAKEQVDRLDE